MTQRGIILFGHGSRDPLWRKPIEAVAAQIQQFDSQVQVRCAYLEITEPDLPACAAAMWAAGVRSITIVPMFLGVGRHAREDLPVLIADLRTKYPDIEVTLQTAIGEEPRLVELMAKIALSR